MLETDRVVLLRCDVDGGTQVGSGLRIGGEQVLTADHCVTGENLRVVHGGREFPAQVVVRSFTSAVDVAVLLVPGLGAKPPLGFARVDRQIAGAVEGCQALGYPRWKVGSKTGRTLVQLDGRIPTAEGLLANTQEAQPAGLLSLKLPSQGIPLPSPPPKGSLYTSGSPWGGMSGAAVVSDGLVLGVLRSHNISEGNGSLTVTPIDAIDSLDPEIRDVMWSTLGVSDPRTLTLLPRSNDPGTEVEEQKQDGKPRSPTGAPKEISRTQVIKKVTKTWVESGPSVAVLQGFSGSGKTKAALDIRSLHPRRKVLDVEIPEGMKSLEQLILLIGDAFAAAGKIEVAMGANPRKNLADAMSDGTVLILDNFQNCFAENSDAPPADVQELINSVGRHIRGTPGRLLLVSNEVAFPWMEYGETFTLPGMSVPEGSRLLSEQLRQQGIPAEEIPTDRVSEVISWLGGNPRAITLLAACLRSDNLEDLIGPAPEPWELRDRSVSRGFSKRLERAFLERCIGRLSEVDRKLLNRVSVNRISFTNETFKRSFWDQTPQEFDAAKKRLTSSFLVERRRNNYAVNPIAREISLGALEASGTELRKAHAAVGRFHSRHFNAKRILGTGADFLEARYHLYAAGETNELSTLAKSYVLHLERLYGYKRALEQDPKERDELIALLSAALSEVSPSWRLHHYLARLLEARGAGGDHAKALEQVDRAVRSPNAVSAAWILKARLTDQLFGTESAIAVVTEAQHRLADSTQKTGQILFFHAELLARDSQRITDAAALYKKALSVAEGTRLPHLYTTAAESLAVHGEGLFMAIDILREGITQLPPNAKIVSLYLLAAEYLVRAGDQPSATEEPPAEGSRGTYLDKAVELLREGIGRIPPQSNLFSLYQAAGELLARSGQVDQAVHLLREGIGRVPPQSSLFSLYQSAGALLAGSNQVHEAVELLREGITRIPPQANLFALYQSAGELLAGSNQVHEAVELLREGITRIPPQSNLFSLYQSTGELLARNNHIEEAIELLREGITRIPTQSSLFSLYQAAGELLGRNNQVHEAVELLREGIGRIPPQSNLFALYQAAGELLARNNQVHEAVELLREGIGRIPPQSSLFSLYQSTGELLARNGRMDEAIELLREGITRIPPQSSLFSLYQAAGELLARDNQIEEAVELLREGIGRIPPQSNLFSLYQSAGELLARNGRMDEAIELLREGITRIPPHSSLFSLYQAAGELLARNGQVGESVELLREGIGRIPPHANLFALYQLAGDLLARDGRITEAAELLREGIQRVPLQSNLSSLYQTAGDLLTRIGRVDEAIELLLSGIARFPSHSDHFPILRHAAMTLAWHERADEAEDLLRKSVSEATSSFEEAKCYGAWVQLLSATGRHPEAVDKLMEGIRIFAFQGYDGDFIEKGITAISSISGGCSLLGDLRPRLEELSLEREVRILDLLDAEEHGDWQNALDIATAGRQEFRSMAFFHDHELLALAALGRNDCVAERLLGQARKARDNASRWLRGYVLALVGDAGGCYEAMAPWVARRNDEATDDPLAFCVRVWEEEIHRPRGGRYPLRFPFLPVLVDGDW